MIHSKNNIETDITDIDNPVSNSQDQQQGSSKSPLKLSAVSIEENDDFSDIELLGSGETTTITYPRSVYTGIAQQELNPNITVLSDSEIGYLMWSFYMQKSTFELSGIYYDGLLKLLQQLGVYRKTREKSLNYILVREQNNILEEVDLASVKQLIKDHIEALQPVIQFSYGRFHVSIERNKLLETYLRFAPQKIDDKFLQLLPLHTKPVLRDTSSCSYFYFQNSIQKVSAESIESIPYPSLIDTCIWMDHIIKRELIYTQQGDLSQFSQFIRNVTNNELSRLTAFKSAIGYLLNNYSSPSQTQAIIMYDEEITDVKNPMGGTGKGVNAKSIAELRKVTKIDGKKFIPSDRFKFQDVDVTTQVVWLDDISPQVGFETFHSCLTDGWSIEKKFKDSFLIPADKSPKLLITSNTILQGSGTTNKRRQFVLEFSNHYSSKIRKGNEKPIEAEHGGLFFTDTDWDAQEWSRFYSYMLDCCQFYHKYGLVNYEIKSAHLNLLRQSTSDEFFEWVQGQSFGVTERYKTEEFYKAYLDFAGLTKDMFGYRDFADYLKKYASSREWKHVSFRANGVQYFRFEVFNP